MCCACSVCLNLDLLRIQTETSEMDSMSNKSTRYSVKLSKQVIDLAEGVRFVESPKCGAINSFLGVVRELEGSRTIEALYYEAYETMAKRQISEIVKKTIEDSNEEDSRAYVNIRLGKVPVQQASIYICVSSRGRNWSHQATLSILDRIKSSVVIWKKALFSDSDEQWVDQSRSEAWWLRQNGGIFP